MEIRQAGAPQQPTAAFRGGAVVLVTLNTPREKFWGAVLEITPAGVSIRGLDLNCFDDFARQVRDGESPTPGLVFFPMHRVERMELDARNGDIPSLRERFEEKAGVDLAASLGALPDPGIRVGCTLAEAQRLLRAATVDAVEGDLARAARILGLSEEELRSGPAR